MNKLHDYIKKHLDKGISEDQIHDHLVMYGWESDDVNETIFTIQRTPKRKIGIAIVVALVLLSSLFYASFILSDNNITGLAIFRGGIKCIVDQGSTSYSIDNYNGCCSFIQETTFCEYKKSDFYVNGLFESFDYLCTKGSSKLYFKEETFERC